jgi:hypothetical protein
MEIQIFQVEGAGRFPFDMLRYDCCFPYTEIDTACMVADKVSRRIVTLARHIETKESLPCDGRWRSFGWRVVSLFYEDRGEWSL